MPRQARGGEQLCRAQHASVPSAPMSPLGVLPPRARPRAELRGHGQGMWAPGALPSGCPSAPAPGWSASSPGNRPVASGAEHREVPRGLVHAGRKSSLDRGATSAHADPAAPDPDSSMAFHTHPRRCLGDSLPPGTRGKGLGISSALWCRGGSGARWGQLPLPPHLRARGATGQPQDILASCAQHQQASPPGVAASTVSPPGMLANPAPREGSVGRPWASGSGLAADPRSARGTASS